MHVDDVDDVDDVNDGDVMGRDTFTMSGRRGEDSGDGLNGLLPDRDVSALWLLEPREDSSAYSSRFGSSSNSGGGEIGGIDGDSSATELSNDTDSSDLTRGSSENSSSSGDSDVEMDSREEGGVLSVGTIWGSEDLSNGGSQRHGKHVEYQ